VGVVEVVELLGQVELGGMKQIRLAVVMDSDHKLMLCLIRQLKRCLALTSLHLRFVYHKANKNKYSFNSHFNQLSFPFL